MDVFQGLTMLGGLALFLFGMQIMGQALERRTGGGLRELLGKMTSGRLAGFLTGSGVTAVIQSSSAVTVMVVGFVNSGLMNLRQAANVIMGANVGTTMTSWILSLSGMDSKHLVVRLLKPSSFSPVLAFVGILYYMFAKSSKKKDTGLILLGFSTLLFGMDTMASAVSGLAELPAFRQMFLLFQNPFLGLAAGALLTALIQSSSASVGILQVLAETGQITFAAAIPIVMGQNIGTCVTAILSAVGAGKNAKRAAFLHLAFNVLGAFVLLAVFLVGKAAFSWPFLESCVNRMDIALIHTVFNGACVLLLLPAASLLEKLALLVIRDAKEPEATVTLDERLLATPTIALEQCRSVAFSMAETAVKSVEAALTVFSRYTEELAEQICRWEAETDRYEDLLSTYLIKLSARKLREADSQEITAMLKMIGDYERMADHARNILESAQELDKKSLSLTNAAKKEYQVLAGAVREIAGLSLAAFVEEDAEAVSSIEPLEQVIDDLKEQMRTRHIRRMQRGDCTIEAGFIWSDLLTNLERTADHCSNIAGCRMDGEGQNLNIHETLRKNKRENLEFQEKYRLYRAKYSL